MGQADDVEDLLGKVWGGRYQILEFVGRGGMGMVFKARHLQMDRIVALKVIHRKLCQDEKQVQRFEQEARTSSKLHHPNSIRVYDYGTSDDARLFMAMEFLAGITLGKLIQNEGPQPPERVIHIARQIIKSLSEAHELGLVHRDLKPENIVICDIYGERDFVKVLDFGIAKAIGPSEEQMNLTQTGFICGTPRYLSPEQALGHEVDGRADLYSVGVLMYEMLTGRPPFIGENPISIVMKHVHDDPPPLTGMEKYGDDGRKITWLVERLLDKNPERRPSPGERIVEFVDGRIDESELMGRPVSMDSSTTATRRSAAGHPSRGSTPDYVEDASETMPPVSSDAKTIPPVPPLELNDPSYRTAVLENTTLPPRPPPVPTSDETAMIQRPEVIATRESASPAPTAQDAPDDGAGETRILSLQELMPEAASPAEPELPRIRRSAEPRIRSEDKARPPRVRPEERAAPLPRHGRPRDPLWAWVTAGFAVAILILSVVVYLTVPGSVDRPDLSVAEVAAEPSSVAQEPASPPSVAGQPASAPGALNASPTDHQAPQEAAKGPNPGLEVAPEAKSSVLPETSGQLVGRLLAKIEMPASAPQPVPAAPVEPALPASSHGTEAPEPSQVTAPGPGTTSVTEPAVSPRDAAWAAKVMSTAKQRLEDAAEKARAAKAEAAKAEAAKAEAAKAEAAKAEAARAEAAKRAETRAAERRRARANASDSGAESKPKPKPKPQAESMPKPKPKPKAQAESKPKPKPKDKPRRKSRPKATPSFDPF